MKHPLVQLVQFSLSVVLLVCLAIGYSRAHARTPSAAPLAVSLLTTQNTELDVSICDPAAGPFSLEITNRYLPFSVGNVWVFKGLEDGVKLRLRITVLDETEVVAGVTTRVVEERERADGELVEVSRNFFAQAPDGTVCYFGEDVDIYENGRVVSHEGAWRAGRDSARPGIIMPGNPRVGISYAQEVAPGIAEDRAKIVSIGKTVTVPAGTFEDTLRTRETNPLEPGAVSFKVYAPGVGLIVDDVVELVRFVHDGDDDGSSDEAADPGHTADERGTPEA